ncbi:MAG: PIN domain-containing protein [Prevotella sp.]|nr:PIN domain-containing protein [Prevotella sp.]
MKKKYLLDTCICIHFLQNRPEVVKKIQQIGWDKCCIAEATIGELLCGVRDDGRKARNVNIIESFVSDIEVVPTGLAIREYAKQKRVLQSQGRPIEDFDILIGASAIVAKAIMVTENVGHLERLNPIKIENWVVR